MVSKLPAKPWIVRGVHAHRKGAWRVEVQSLVCLLYVHCGPDYPEQMPELTLQVWAYALHLLTCACASGSVPLRGGGRNVRKQR